MSQPFSSREVFHWLVWGQDQIVYSLLRSEWETDGSWGSGEQMNTLRSPQFSVQVACGA
jgi:hypothetical protein